MMHLLAAHTLPPRVEPIEVIWTIIALFGFIFSIFNAIGAQQDLRTYSGSGKNGFGLVLLSGARTNEVLRSIALFSLLTVGFFALGHQPQVARTPEVTPFVIAFQASFFTCSVILVTKSVLAFRLRIKLKAIAAGLGTSVQTELHDSANNR